MYVEIIAVLLGLVLLVYSAERFVEGAAVSAKYAGASPLLIGMLVVGFGTSAPEMMVSVFAAYEGNPNIALGNAYGSNIINIAFVLGLTAILYPITVSSKIVRKELPLLLAIVLFSGWLIFDNILSLIDIILLLAGFVALIVWSVLTAKQHRSDELASDVSTELASTLMSRGRATFWLIIGLLLLLLSAKILVWGAQSIAVKMGISDLIIGLTIIALGTSLPELAATIAAAKKGEHDIAIGNIIGSNMFNMLAVVGFSGIFGAIPVDDALVYRDWPVMLATSLMLLVMAYGYKKLGAISRKEGGILVLSFIVYNTFLLYSINN
ncbi:calcium/sodium antiporter [Brumicola blandensis]|uniref:Calcium/sodium antiporter n=1 Tax=Brumicola blandensis TaxID=3075611 RepID=A0AAW8QZY9_9ALTE|nr:calcium/sodium antiporter [Alteromonas sp. W409]MDT0581512.1 calcium/sodium antiporter [Alteromonas sp. W409]